MLLQCSAFPGQSSSLGSRQGGLGAFETGRERSCRRRALTYSKNNLGLGGRTARRGSGRHLRFSGELSGSARSSVGAPVLDLCFFFRVLTFANGPPAIFSGQLVEAR